MGGLLFTLPYNILNSSKCKLNGKLREKIVHRLLANHQMHGTHEARARPKRNEAGEIAERQTNEERKKRFRSLFIAGTHPISIGTFKIRDKQIENTRSIDFT